MNNLTVIIDPWQNNWFKFCFVFCKSIDVLLAHFWFCNFCYKIDKCVVALANVFLNDLHTLFLNWLQRLMLHTVRNLCGLEERNESLSIYTIQWQYDFHDLLFIWLCKQLFWDVTKVQFSLGHCKSLVREGDATWEGYFPHSGQ